MERAEAPGETVQATPVADWPIDPRVTGLMDCADDFANARVVETADEARRLAPEADAQRLTFLLGVDANGRDLFARILISLRVSLKIGALATGVARAIGARDGATAGFVGGLMKRAVDILNSPPSISFATLRAVSVGRNVTLMFVAVGCIAGLDMARTGRGQALSLERRDVVTAAAALGVSQGAILRRHVIPDTLGAVIVDVTPLAPEAILLERFLSRLGPGAQAPLTSPGAPISEGAKNLRDAPDRPIWPALTLTLLLFALNFLGDGRRDALDPKDRRDVSRVRSTGASSGRARRRRSARAPPRTAPGPRPPRRTA